MANGWLKHPSDRINRSQCSMHRIPEFVLFVIASDSSVDGMHTRRERTSYYEAKDTITRLLNEREEVLE